MYSFSLEIVSLGKTDLYLKFMEANGHWTNQERVNERAHVNTHLLAVSPPLLLLCSSALLLLFASPLHLLQTSLLLLLSPPLLSLLLPPHLSLASLLLQDTDRRTSSLILRWTLACVVVVVSVNIKERGSIQFLVIQSGEIGEVRHITDGENAVIQVLIQQKNNKWLIWQAPVGSVASDC